MNSDVEQIRVNQELIQNLHANEEYEKALDKLEDSQRIVKTHYGTQSTEVSCLIRLICSPISQLVSDPVFVCFC